MMGILYMEDFCMPGGEYSGDAFFLDTNALIAYVSDDHPYHLTTVIHIVFLLTRGAKVFISEIVVAEAIDVIARLVYVEECFQQWSIGPEHAEWSALLGRAPTKADYNARKDQFRGEFTARVVKNHVQPDLLKRYNAHAEQILSSAIDTENFKLSNTSYRVLKEAMWIAKTVPLQSNDALIASAAGSKRAGIVTFDNDFKQVAITCKYHETTQPLQIFSAKITNNYYRSQNRAQLRMDELDPTLWTLVQMASGGPEKFQEKFGPRHSARLLSTRR